ncbi:hypothetical protein VSDG_09461 [Cytospora chrysosperma]|uniref:Uncharacterized protein n=1 Tax=Cytospora chrysosperma TaxID=252740 RepID=A0A423VAK1_CYTCH|nr:hypothetical protein VSDG_09461 [Valsa sordida]
MVSEKVWWAYIGSAFGGFALIIMLSFLLAYKLGLTKPVRPLRNGAEFELSDLTGPRDLERGVVRDWHHLPDPDMFLIPEEEGESPPAADRSARMTRKYPMPTVQAVKNDSKIGLELDRDMGDANGQNRGDLRSGADARTVRPGVLEPVMGGAILIHGDGDDETLLIPSGAAIPRSKSRRGSKGKGKAREVDEDSSSSSEPFGLSHFLSPRTGSRAPNFTSAPVGFDHVLPSMPRQAKTRESRGRSISRWPVDADMPHPSRFVVLDTNVSSEEDNVVRWKPEPPKVSRYRGLSATRPGQKPRTPSPPLPLFPVDDALPLPAPETFNIRSTRDSWGYFSSRSEAEPEPEQSSVVDSDEWTSEVFSTVVGPRPDETAFHTADTSTGADKTEAKAETGKDDSGSVAQYPVWEHGGPLVPDPRVLTQNASLPGRKAKFVEVDVDGPAAAAGSPGTTSNVFRDCLELLREGARTPTILTDLGYHENERPGLARGKTWAMSGALFQRRRDESGGAGEGSSRPQVARSKTSQA